MTASEPEELDLDQLVERSRAGDAAALEALLMELRDPIYRLALRMTACPEDAEDATQEILIKVLTRLDSFRGDAAVTTWAYRVAANHLLDRAKSTTERLSMTFSDFSEDLSAGLAAPSAATDPANDLLAREVKQGCTLAVLTCLDRESRLAYVLGEILELPPVTAAEVCSTTEVAFRKRLSRARQKIRRFLESNCGLVSPGTSACHCRRRVPAALAAGRIDGAIATIERARLDEATVEIETLYDAASLVRSRADPAAPERTTARLVDLVRSGRFAILD